MPREPQRVLLSPSAFKAVEDLTAPCARWCFAAEERPHLAYLLGERQDDTPALAVNDAA